ncbi:MAG: hypothetical protein QM775_24230 [Pirellulales bacterium]
MPIAAVCDCGQTYSLKEEFAGKKVKCPACNSAFTVPEPTLPRAQADPIFDRDKFLVRQKKIAVSQKYFVGDERDIPLAFVHRPAAILRGVGMILLSMIWVLVCVFAAVTFFDGNGRRDAESWQVLVVVGAIVVGLGGIFYMLAPKRHVTFYRDKSMREHLMVVRQEFKLALVNANYTLVDSAGTAIAMFRKNYLYNIIRRRWYISDPAGRPICVAIEDSILLSILRRFLGPMFGLLRTNFQILTPDFGDTIGEFNRKLTLFDKYVLDMSQDPERTLDRRIALALGVMLDTGEHR